VVDNANKIGHEYIGIQSSVLEHETTVMLRAATLVTAGTISSYVLIG